jgi:predicted Fe-Mo cluster-binding NifX family protein
MADTPTKVIVDCSTGEQTVVPLTAEEIAQREADALAAAELKAQEEADAQAKAAAKQAAQDKLKALGLSDLEVAALVGA